MSVLGTANILAAIGSSYRPPSWGARATQTYSMTCTLPGPVDAENPPKPITFFFDATLRAEHAQEAVGTRHPVQVGPAVVDHVYLLPARVTLDVAISDSMQSFLAGQYSGGSSRSVSAYQTFKQVQAARVPIALSTRLDTYANMWLVDVRAVEDRTTSRSFRGMLRFEQIISAQIAAAVVSERPDATATTNEGTKGATIPAAAILGRVPVF